MLARLLERLSEGRSGRVAGGIHLLFIGDFAQFPPVADVALYCYPRSAEKDVDLKDCEIGWNAWHNLIVPEMDVVFLHKQMRQQNDAQYLDLLEAVRDGRCTQAHVEYLSQRVISEATRDLAESAKFAASCIIVSRNELRHHINNTFVHSFAAHRGETVFLSQAIDRRAKNKPISSIRHDTLLDLIDSQAGYLMGRLPLVPLLPVMITYNIATELGITNGTLGTLLSIVFDPEDHAARDNDQKQPMVFLQRQPLYLLVHVPTAQMLNPLPGLPLNVIPVFSHEQRFTYRRLTYYRRQFPIVPAKAITDMKTQGLTLLAAHVRIAHDGASAKAKKLAGRSARNYVPLSRVKSLQDILITETFTLEDLNRTPDPLLLAHMQRLKARAADTAKRMMELHPGRFDGVLASLDKAVPQPVAVRKAPAAVVARPAGSAASSRSTRSSVAKAAQEALIADDADDRRARELLQARTEKL